MNKLVLLLTVSFTCAATAEARFLECKGIHAPEHFGPIFTAKFDDSNNLSKMKFDYRGPIFSSYRINETENLENWGNKPRVQKGVLKQPKGTAEPEEITSNHRTTYKGNNAYAITFGHYSDKWPSDDFPELKDMNDDYDYVGELVLPKDLSPEALDAFRFHGRETEKSNAVMIYAPAPGSDQGGDNYLRMFCKNVEQLTPED